ncbi:hypothetical protein [Pyrinomonas methylaliphatogenes]|uniref:Uncharacterized protein n=1 Tax=Pyrinomonas methylaliphatogenes TaxID=454194 RepID=A0A0B6WYY2_9BACT|nr:hypothetical protein [Pyrinomonas methylaliphatogenes]CDM65499.1 hypothetical protein PYK22_01501 [Pyrinomonas methylaliphatogenes]
MTPNLTFQLPLRATLLLLLSGAALAQTAQRAAPPIFLWYEAENMQGLSRDARNEPILNPSWIDPPRERAPGWGISGPGVSAEWSQGGESEWNSVAASADETRAALFQEIEIPRSGRYRVWVRYADWAKRTENFSVRLVQRGREIFRHEFGARDLLDPHDEVSMYWGWAFVWDGAECDLVKGPATLYLEIEKRAEARRQVDCLLITNDLNFRPEGRRKPEFPALRLLREWSEKRTPVAPLLESDPRAPVPRSWQRPKLAGRDFLLPWNIAPEFWKLYDRPPADRPLYPFNAEPIEEFIAKYKGKRDVPIFSSPLIAPVIYINELPQLLREGSPFLRYLRETRAPFAVLINYGTAQMSDEEGRSAWRLLTGELRDQFLGWISGESIGHVWGEVAQELRLSPTAPRRDLLEAYHRAYTRALERKWSALFHTPTGPMWDKLIVAQSTSSTAYAHALGRWGCRIIGLETAAVQPIFALRLGFTRGAARQYGAAILYYHAPNFGDTATTFTKQQNFAGPDYFYHTRYGPTMGPSLSWYRKSLYYYYMAGVSAIYFEQGFDQFFKPGPGDHPFQLNPLGRITDEFVRFVEKHPERGIPYTPVAFLLDPAHGWDMTDYPHLPFGVSPINRSDRALRELLTAAYYPAPAVEGEPATGDRQAFVNSIFGDIFDVLVASAEGGEALDAYRALIVGGRIAWTPEWERRLTSYVESGGTLVLNAAQAAGLSPELLGLRLRREMRETDRAECLLPEAESPDLSGQPFRYQLVELRGAQTLMRTPSGDPLVTSHRLGRGRVIFCAIPDLLGEDERLTTVAAHLLIHLLAEATPVEINGEVERAINRTERGFVITLINNNGVFKPQQGLAQVDRRAEVAVTIKLKRQKIATANEWTENAPLEIDHRTDEIRLRIPPGDLRIVEIKVGDPAVHRAPALEPWTNRRHEGRYRGQ